jgi:hypothetical protein
VKETTSKAHKQVHTNKESREKQPGRKPGPNRAETGLGRPAWADRPSPLRARFGALFALGVHLFIASSSVCRHIDPIILPTSFTRNRRRKMRERVGRARRKDQRRRREGSKRMTPSRWSRGVPKLHHRHLHRRRSPESPSPLWASIRVR